MNQSVHPDMEIGENVDWRIRIFNHLVDCEMGKTSHFVGLKSQHICSNRDCRVLHGFHIYPPLIHVGVSWLFGIPPHPTIPICLPKLPVDKFLMPSVMNTQSETKWTHVWQWYIDAFRTTPITSHKSYLSFESCGSLLVYQSVVTRNWNVSKTGYNTWSATTREFTIDLRCKSAILQWYYHRWLGIQYLVYIWSTVMVQTRFLSRNGGELSTWKRFSSTH